MEIITLPQAIYIMCYERQNNEHKKKQENPEQQQQTGNQKEGRR
jgi:tRNA C32,U32 (ribose-2'-O)-methylase TrmJ